MRLDCAVVSAAMARKTRAEVEGGLRIAESQA